VQDSFPSLLGFTEMARQIHYIQPLNANGKIKTENDTSDDLL